MGRHPNSLEVIGLKGPDVASAGTIVPLWSQGDSFDVTGVATCNYCNVVGLRVGKEVTFQFDAGATVAHNTGTVPAGTVPFLLAGAVNFVATAGDTLTLWYDGAALRETSRAVI